MVHFNIGAFVHKPQGSKEVFDINEKLIFDAQSKFDLTGQVRARVQLLKLPHEINVMLKDLKFTVNCICGRCLKHFQVNVNVPFAEREFIIDLDEHDLMEGEEVFYVAKGSNEIVLDEMIREEIMLHSPHIPVCFEGCKGLCYRCGVNLNEASCNCHHDHPSGSSPFKALNL